MQNEIRVVVDFSQALPYAWGCGLITLVLLMAYQGFLLVLDFVRTKFLPYDLGPTRER